MMEGSLPSAWTVADLRRVGSSLGIEALCLRYQERLLKAAHEGSLARLSFGPDQQFAQAKLMQVALPRQQQARRTVFVEGTILQKSKDLIHPLKRSKIELLSNAQLRRLLMEISAPEKLQELVEKQGVDGRLIQIDDSNLAHIKGSRLLLWLKDLLQSISCCYEFMEAKAAQEPEMAPFLFSVRQSFRQSVYAESFMENQTRNKRAQSGFGILFPQDLCDSQLMSEPKQAHELSTLSESEMGDSQMGSSSMGESELAVSTPGMEGSVYLSEGEYSEFSDSSAMNKFVDRLKAQAPPLPFNPFQPNRTVEIGLIYVGTDRQQRRKSAGVEGLSIGRSSQNDICFPQQMAISSVHVLIWYDFAQRSFMLQDMGSKAGTYYRMQSFMRLIPGCEVHIPSVATLYFHEIAKVQDTVTAKLTVSVKNSTSIASFSLKAGREGRLGSEEGCELVLLGKESKARHCRVRAEDEGLLMEEWDGTAWLRLSARGQISAPLRVQRGSEFRLQRSMFKVCDLLV